MNFALQPTFIDIFVVFVILFMAVMGYIKGFIVRIYDLLATIVALVASMFLCGPLGEIFVIYKVEGIASMVGSFINRLIVFVLLFIIAKILFWIVGMVVKPTVRGLLSKIGLIEKFDKLLGVLLSLVQSCIILYIVLIMIVSPLFSGGKKAIEDTMVAKYVLNIIPSLSDTVMNLTDNFDAFNGILSNGLSYDQLSGQNLDTITSLLGTLLNTGVIDQQHAIDTINDYFDSAYQNNKKIEMTAKQYSELEKVLALFDDQSIDKSRIINKITVSE